MMENHTTSPSTSPCFFFENNNGSLYPSDLVLTMIEDGTSSVSSSPLSSNSSTSSNGNLSPTSSHQSLGISSPSSMSFPCCVFRCRPSSHPFQERCIPLNEPIKVGRAVGRLKPLPNNAIFDCKVLSRQHAKLWYENGKVRFVFSFYISLFRFPTVSLARYEKFQWNICEQSKIGKM